MEWLFTAIDSARPHLLSAEAAWHGRAMMLAWAFFIPLGVISARFFKITPRQNWPEQLDNQAWWITHLVCQYVAAGLMIFAVVSIWQATESPRFGVIHHYLGWTTLALCSLQFMAGWLRGSKGGPTELARTGTLRGDHFDMTRRRRIFEHLHKSVGYLSLSLAIAASSTGLWLANAPHWMWLGFTLWWCFIIAAFIFMQRLGMADDTYEAIYGPDATFPGNQIKPIGYGIKRRHSRKSSLRHQNDGLK